MQRITYRALALPICALLLVGLIGTSQLPPQSERIVPLAGLAALALPALTAPVSDAVTPNSPATPSMKKQAFGLASAHTFRAQSIGSIIVAPPPSVETQPAPKPVPAWIAGAGPRMRGQLVAQTERLDLYVGSNTFSPDQIAGRAAKLERVLRAAEDYFGTTLEHRISIGFYSKPPKRGVRGMAYTDQSRVEIYYRAGEDIGRATTVAMHEMGHHLEAQRYGEVAQRRADTILHEGLATWIASIRWLDQCGASSWRERGQQLRDSGIPLRLLTAERSGPDNAYELWASFVDYLIRQYGWKKFNALYASGRGRAPGSADYERVLGKSLDELSDDWRAWLGQ